MAKLSFRIREIARWLENKKMKKSNIILVGMPGTGKSTLGALMAKSLRKTFVDTDTLIENIAGRPIQKSLDELGNEAYGKLEHQALMDIDQNNLVIATGGSAIYQVQAMRYLKQNATVIHLSASFETLNQRIKNFNSRAIVMNKGMSFADLYAQRMPLYQELADIEFVTDQANESPQDSMKRVISALQTHSGCE